LASLMGEVAGALLGFMNVILAYLLVSGRGSLYSAFGLVPTIAAGAVFVLSFLFLAWEGPTTREIFAIAVAGASVVTLILLTLSFWRSRQGAPGYAQGRSQGVALGAMGGTNFRGADLRGAFLSGARLRGSNFASAPMRSSRLRPNPPIWPPP
jgi:hypothetical protein